MHMLYMMRYSFFGHSGWRSDASQNPDLLLDPARLEQRAYYLSKIALRSLADQTDEDFELIVLSSTLMPETHQTALRELCGDLLGRRAHVIFRDPDTAGAAFQAHRRRNFARYATTTQIVLDDDDAVSRDFTARLRAEAEAANALIRVNGPDYCFISHPRGITAEFKAGQLSLTHRLMPATNLGLALTSATATRRNPFNIAHKKILERRPVRVIYGPDPCYIRTVHATNDSRAASHERGPLVTADQMQTMLKAFPLLRGLGADWPMSEGQQIPHAA